MKPGSDGTPLFQLPGSASQPLPYLGYAPGAYLGQMVEFILKQSSTAIHLDRAYETDMAEGLKAMALEGHGIAFLPYSAVKKELRAHRLVSALPPNMRGMNITMDVRVYREKLMPKETHRNANDRTDDPAPRRKSNAQALWNYLLAQSQNSK